MANNSNDTSFAIGAEDVAKLMASTYKVSAPLPRDVTEPQAAAIDKLKSAVRSDAIAGIGTALAAAIPDEALVAYYEITRVLDIATREEMQIAAKAAMVIVGGFLASRQVVDGAAFDVEALLDVFEEAVRAERQPVKDTLRIVADRMAAIHRIDING